MVVRDSYFRSNAPWLVLGALLLCACSVYEPRHFTSQSTDGVTGTAGVPAPDAGSDGGVVDCEGEDFARCLRPHAEARCVDGNCIITQCLDDYVDCDTEAANGCETRLDSVEHCGVCGSACRMSRGNARCRAGACELVSCEGGYGSCDDDPNNGCETKLNSLSDCGACGRSCDAPDNAVARCSEGTCGIGSCSSGFGDCNQSPDDGCEQALTTLDHCGGCGEACAPPHGAGDCDSGACVVSSCEQGWKNCNGLAADGCETSIRTIDHCGACGRRCQLPHVANESCTGTGTCTIDRSCDSEDPTCDPDAATNGCDAGYSDCDGDPQNGCETDLSRLSDCGACDNFCVQPNTETACRDGGCTIVSCRPGARQCGDGAACSILADDPQNCGECGRACTEPGSRQCAGGRCTGETCPAGLADCDGIDNNGCETDLTTVQNCGLCGISCPALPHASTICRAGSCAIDQCEPGWSDCDTEVANGCEVDIRSTNDCNGCAKPCLAADAVTSCTDGSCRITSCTDGRDNCNNSIEDGCESDLRLPDTCGACQNVCLSLPNVDSSSCEDASCKLVCGTGRADCDGLTANGCEADLSAATSCGRCGTNCNQLANVRSARCEGGGCKDIVCHDGFADCNGDPSDGCESSLRTTTDCGACNRACAPAGGQGSCATGSCALMQCEEGFADCNGNAADGCETSLATDRNCGACGNTCRDGIRCMNGHCGCASDAECAEGLTCCNGTCANTRTACFVWPCLPGFEVRESRENCGACGEICLLWCCLG